MATVPEMINAKILRLGFFDGSKQFFHICNIKIITSTGLEIQKACNFSLTSTAYQSPGQLKHILVDNITNSFCHSSNGANEYLVVDFLKEYTIKEIIIENRNNDNGVRDRIINAQFRLYNIIEKKKHWYGKVIKSKSEINFITSDHKIRLFTLGNPECWQRKWTLPTLAIILN